MHSPRDLQFMARALKLARRGIYITRPNPAVGCVLVRDGQVIAEGSTQAAGGNHAEIEALQAATDSVGCTAYVTLEPCSHQGRTGPCVRALIEAGVSRVVIAMADPNPEVGGEGVSQLRAAGIEVVEDVLSSEAESINPGFYRRMRTGLPRVQAKLASSLDGRTAMASGESKWITGTAARADVQQLRARSGAIVTGVGTVIHDDPAMTMRDERFDIPSQPLRVILDSGLRTPPAAKILQQPGQTLIAHARDNAVARGELAAHADLVALPGDDGRVDLHKLLEELASRQCNDILVECGARLAGAFLQQGLLDELVIYMAPTLMGSDALPLMELPLQQMSAQVPLEVVDLRQVGDDYRWTLAPKG
jgi:diaminohydroxyphosphoribosylaminopyrimidine deaminase/5-amino-6-(5-phosphoribosylamino)uracil reductase